MKLNFKGNYQDKNPMHTIGNCLTLGDLDTFLLTVLGEPKLLVMKDVTATIQIMYELLEEADC